MEVVVAPAKRVVIAPLKGSIRDAVRRKQLPINHRVLAEYLPGTVVLSEIGRLGIGGQVHALEAQGLDTFHLLILPRACAFAIASFSLGILFLLATLVTGFIAGSLLDAVNMSIWSFFDRVLLALHVRDFVIVPAKLIVMGLLVALTTCVTALTASPSDDIASLLPRGFMRGVLLILIASLALTLVA
jgi:phospholipid/cholesterol/gamma-HCH transport system permease protein